MPKKIRAPDFSSIAEFIEAEFSRRKERRKDLEKDWKEIDRQIAMKPDTSFKLFPKSEKPIPHKAWMPEIELPLQAQTLEVLTADARRMEFPDSGPWYAAHGEMSDAYQDRVLDNVTPISDKNIPPSLIDQDNTDKLIEGWGNNFRRQYDFGGHMDLINAGAFAYGMGVGRGRVVTKEVFIETARGVMREKIDMPVLFPRSIKNTYLDDTAVNVMNEGYFLGPSVIHHERKTFADIKQAANRGKTDARDPNGGWMPKHVSGMDIAEDQTVEVVELEGDLVIPRKSTRSIFLPGSIATIIRGIGKNKSRVIRFRIRKFPFSSYILFPYHHEGLDSPYASAPLMKGRPLQKAATEAFCRLLQVGALNAEPPIHYDRTDTYFAQEGGPLVYPAALWGSVSPVTPQQIGDPAALLQNYIAIIQHYADVTGVNAPRLGAQTVSHTTAFAKDVELSRGVIRTVDYTRSTLQGGLMKWLSMEYEMGRDAMGRRRDTIYLDTYRGFVELTKMGLPDNASFEVFGSGGPAEDQLKRQNKLNAIQTALQLDMMALQAGGQATLLPNMPNVIQQVLREGGWVDVEAFTGAAGVSSGTSGPSLVEADPGGNGVSATAALQALAS